MDARRAAQLEQAIAEVQERWGSYALCALRESAAAAPREGLTTGFPALDALTGAGGIPASSVTALAGAPSSGVTSLAYRLAAGAERPALWLDTNRLFDPASARACGVDFQRLLLSRPADWARALALARDVAEHLSTILILLPLPLEAAADAPRLLVDLLRVLPAICHRGGNTLVLLSSGADWPRWGPAILPRVALALQVARVGWLPGMAGLQTRVTVLKSRCAPPGAWADVPLAYPELP